MSKRGSSGEISVGTEAWNVADGFTKLKILKNLVFMDRYELVALYGSEDMEAEGLSQHEVNKRRVSGIRRMASCLRLVLGNVKFAITKKDLKEQIESYKKRWKQVDEVLDQTYYYTSNFVNNTSELFINEELFGYCLNILREVKDDLNLPLNYSGLIFRENEEIDLDKIENDIVHGG